MFLNLFRKRSNQKYINKVLNSKRLKISEKKIRSVGIILSLDEYKDYDKLRDIFVNLGVNENKIKFITISNFLIGSKSMNSNKWYTTCITGKITR